MKRVTLKSYRSYKEVFNDMDRLLAEFLRVHKRANKTPLVYTEGGTKERAIYELTAHVEPENVKELEWFKNNI